LNNFLGKKTAGLPREQAEFCGTHAAFPNLQDAGYAENLLVAGENGGKTREAAAMRGVLSNIQQCI